MPPKMPPVVIVIDAYKWAIKLMVVKILHLFVILRIFVIFHFKYFKSVRRSVALRCIASSIGINVSILARLKLCYYAIMSILSNGERIHRRKIWQLDFLVLSLS
jgi:hypothetical protein